MNINAITPRIDTLLLQLNKANYKCISDGHLQCGIRNYVF